MSLRIKAINMLFGACSVQEDGSMLVYKNDTFTTPTIDDLRNIDNTIIDLQKILDSEKAAIEYEIGKEPTELIEALKKVEEQIVDENNVPLSITPLQAKLQLLEIELLDEVEELVKQDRRVEIYWTNAQKFNKDDEILKTMATALGLSSEQLDDLFLQASKL